MKRKYNIAFTPINHREKFIEIANQFAQFADEYLLGAKSNPHLTICQFLVDEKQIDKIWAETCDSLQKKTIDLTFKEFTYTTYKDNIYYISLIPENSVRLHEIHQLVASIVKEPLNLAYAEYDPHVTMINTHRTDCEKSIAEVASVSLPIQDNFVLTLGTCDAGGQMSEIISLADKIIN